MNQYCDGKIVRNRLNNILTKVYTRPKISTERLLTQTIIAIFILLATLFFLLSWDLWVILSSLVVPAVFFIMIYQSMLRSSVVLIKIYIK